MFPHVIRFVSPSGRLHVFVRWGRLEVYPLVRGEARLRLRRWPSGTWALYLGWWLFTWGVR